MRNFKKFLALVLAMLMVSACVLSVSAKFDDQTTINSSGYADAIGILTDLKVMTGKGDGNFDPNGDLTRAEAAVIMAKLSTGIAGQSMDWVSGTTCTFKDVTAKWSFTAINYASQHGIMDGIGNGKFNPDGKLTLAEAIVIAVKAAGYRSEVADLMKTGTASYWAYFWISVAEKHGLTDNVNAFDYTAVCSRAQMAQIAYNVFNHVSAIQTAFKLSAVSGTVAVVSDTTVTLKIDNTKSIKVDRTAFEKAMAASGITGTAADYMNAEFKITYSTDNAVVYGVALLSALKSFTYADGILANVKENNANTAYVTLDGNKYVVADKDEENSGVIGASSVVKAVKIYTVNQDGTQTALAAKADIPTYFKATAYDDDNDGYYNRIVMKVYNIATIAANTVAAKAISGVTYTFDTITTFAGTTFTNYDATDANVRAINYTGMTFSYGETPVLVNVTMNAGINKWDVDVLEVAASVSGKLTAKSSSYITIDSTKYAFVGNYKAVDNWTLNQNITIYTIGGKYASIASASLANKTVIVNKVVANADGSATVTGYDVTNTYADITLNVIGVKSAANKLVTKTSHVIANVNNTTTATYEGNVALGTKNSDGTWSDTVTFEEGKFYNFAVTSDGVYYISTAAATLADYATASTKYGKFEVKNGYVYIDGVAMNYTNNVVILEQVASASKDVYATTYNKYTSYNAKADVRAYMVSNADGKVEFVYVSNYEDLAKETTALASGQTIVQILNGTPVESSFASDTYKAVDLFTGKVVNVTSTSAVAEKGYYVVADGKIVSDADTNNPWVRENTINVEYNGLIGVVKADTTKLVTAKDQKTGVIGTTAQVNETAKAFGIDNIIIYNADANGLMLINSDGVTASTAKVSDVLLNGHSSSAVYTSFVVGSQMIIIKK